jgi:hypothetical protein
MEEGAIVKVNSKDCEKIYIEETKFRTKRRTEQHTKDVEFGRSNSNAIPRHVEEHNHKIDWDNAMCLEKEKNIPKENFRKHLYKRKQTKVYEFKGWYRGEYSIWKGKGGMTEEG